MLRSWLAAKSRIKFATPSNAFQRAQNLCNSMKAESVVPVEPDRNPFEVFFDKRTSGPGIWKWRHYFDAYHRHLEKFRGKPVRLLEIGIYSGGSLDMWRDYFGPRISIIGCDIDPACRKYESENTRVFIGDQADREFWRRIRAEVRSVDVVVDDGGHMPEQQMVTLEETLNWMAPGGVYICEDIHGARNEFLEFANGLVAQLNAFDGLEQDHEDPERRLVLPTSALQKCIHSLHLYPFLLIIEKHAVTPIELTGPKHGTVWEPFLE